MLLQDLDDNKSIAQFIDHTTRSSVMRLVKTFRLQGLMQLRLMVQVRLWLREYRLVTTSPSVTRFKFNSTSIYCGTLILFFQGIKYVLDNRLCHPLLKSLLPNLKNLLHDNSEQVRIAFLDLLLKVKGMRSIKVVGNFVYKHT